MKVVHATPYSAVKQGGVTVTAPALCKAMAARGLDIEVVVQSYPGETSALWPGARAVHAARTTNDSGFYYSPHLKRALRSAIERGDLVHSHGLWTHLSYLTPALARSAGKPHIISPRGMMEPWIVSRSPWKKKLTRALFQNRSLRDARCLHALARAEADNLRALGFKTPIAVIPNGIAPEALERDGSETLAQMFPETTDKKILLFLSRIHPKKGVPHLIEAWIRLAREFPDWHLVIAGPDETGLRPELEQSLEQSGLAHRVTWAGTLSGQRKIAALHDADAFVLPSFSEGFSMAILEAMACGLPVLLTPGCNFPEASQSGGALEVQPDAQSTIGGLRQLMEMTDNQRREMGQKGRDLVAARYTWDRVAGEMMQLYAWCLGGGDAPESVRSAL